MNVADIIAALDLPAGARVDKRVPKKLLVENGAPTAADKRWINEGFEDLHWVAALKATTIGVPEYRDEVREYLEIAVLQLVLRSPAKAGRLGDLVHRAVPYPVLLLTMTESMATVSLAHKRSSQAENLRVVLDGSVLIAVLTPSPTPIESAFLRSLRVADQSAQNLLAFYQGWIDRVLALAAARLTGTYALTTSVEASNARQAALEEHSRIEREIAGLRARAAKERQVNRRVDLNLELKRLETELGRIAAYL